MAGKRNGMHGKAIKRALELVTEAMDVLDAHSQAPDVSAQLALAQQRLRQLSS